MASGGGSSLSANRCGGMSHARPKEGQRPQLSALMPAKLVNWPAVRWPSPSQGIGHPFGEQIRACGLPFSLGLSGSARVQSALRQVLVVEPRKAVQRRFQVVRAVIAMRVEPVAARFRSFVFVVTADYSRVTGIRFEGARRVSRPPKAGVRGSGRSRPGSRMSWISLKPPSAMQRLPPFASRYRPAACCLKAVAAAVGSQLNDRSSDAPLEGASRRAGPPVNQVPLNVRCARARTGAIDPLLTFAMAVSAPRSCRSTPKPCLVS
jgi:hypothetical protein